MASKVTSLPKKSKAKAPEQNLIVVMRHTKSTKGTHVYAVDEGTEDPVCTTVYLRKESLPEDPPATIQLTVSF